MPLLINLLELMEHPLELRGKLPVADLHLGLKDELYHFDHPLEYDLHAEHLGEAVLVQGQWHLPIRCDCARCLRPFTHVIESFEWSAHLPLSGPDEVPQSNDSVDLTSTLREDILLGLPQHPVCGEECGGLKQAPDKTETKSGSTSPGTWDALDKLKL